MKARPNDLRVLCRELMRRGDEHKITVRFEDGIPTAYATESEIVIKALTGDMTTDDLILTRYYFLHELGHHVRRECFDLLKRKSKTLTENSFGVWNCIEDEVQELVTAAGHAGDRRTLTLGRNIHITRMNEDAIADGIKYGQTEPTEDTCKRVAAHCIAMLSRKGWHPHIEGLIENTLRAFGDGKCRTIYSELLSEGWHTRIKLMSVDEAYDLSMELAQRLWPGETQQSEEGEQGEEGEEGSECSNSEGEESEENQGDAGKEEGEPQQKVPENCDDGDGGKPADKPTENPWNTPWEKLVHDNHQEKVEPKEKPVPAGNRNISYAGWTPDGKVTFYPDRKIKWYTGEQVDALPMDYGASRIRFNPDRSFANQLRRYIQSTLRSGWTANKLTGKRINKRHFKRLVTGTSEYNRRVFQTRDEAPGLNTAITLLVDWSGSMYGKRMEVAANAAGVLVDCFENVLGVPVEVIAHTEDYGHVILYDIKRFGERSSGEAMAERLKHCEMGGNADGDALLHAADRLAKRPEKRKVLISIADGNPADAFGGDPATALVRAIEMVKDMGIEVYGIGALHENIKLFYGADSEVVKDLDTLSPTLLTAAKKFTVPR